jgi:plastocyanin
MSDMRQISEQFKHGWSILAVAALVILPGARALGAGAQEKPVAGVAVEVKIDNFTFTPRSVRVAPGTTVTWVNRDDIPHTVVSSGQVSGQLFKSKALDTDDKFSFTFAKAGSYPYFCSLHPKMTGEVVVK